MTWLIVGLVLFLGVHSVSIVAPQWRDAQVALRGEKAWKGVYSVLAIAGFVLLIVGYGKMGKLVEEGMKAGYLLLIAGFLVAAYSTALDTQAVNWLVFVPAGIVAAAHSAAGSFSLSVGMAVTASSPAGLGGGWVLQAARIAKSSMVSR